MCKHQFSIPSKRSPSGCYFDHLMKEVDNVIIPVDDDGKCIFHSKDKDWKIENNFTDYLNRLALISESSSLSEEIDLRDIVFVSDKINSWIELPSIKFEKHINLNGSQFVDDFLINDRVFDGLSLYSVKAYKNFKVSNAKIESFLVEKSRFYCLYLESVSYNSLFDINDVSIDFKCSLNDINFLGLTQIRNLEVGKYEEANLNIKFKNFNQVLIDRVKVNGDFEIFESSINEDVTVNDLMLGGDFIMSDLSLKGTMSISSVNGIHESNDPKLLIYIGEQKFIKNGSFSFNNIDLTKLDGNSKNILDDFLSQRKVVLGDNCTLFRCTFTREFYVNDELSFNIENIFEAIIKYIKIKTNKKCQISINVNEELMSVNIYSDQYETVDQLENDISIAIESLNNQAVIDKDYKKEILKASYKSNREALIVNIENIKEYDDVKELLGTSNAQVFIQNLNIESISSLRVNNPVINDILVGQISSVSYDSELKMSKEQFNDLKMNLMNIEYSELVEIKEYVMKIAKNDKDEIPTFLADTSMSITNSVSATLVFEGLKYIFGF